MKLLNKYTKVHIISAFIMLCFSSLAYYFLIQEILIEQIDKDLRVEEKEIIDYIKLNHKLPLASDYNHQQIKFERVTDKEVIRELSDIEELKEKDDEHEPYRRLIFPVSIDGEKYKAIVYKSKLETEDLLRMIVLITFSLFLLLFAVIFLINRFLLGKIWKPFFYTLNQLKSFDLHAKSDLVLPNSSVQEFDELNKSVTQMAKRVTNDYESLKHFTENASHEMQTPLAIIQSKLDLIIQSSTPSQTEPLQGIFNATERLTRLNQTLLLLTKIGNQQYRDVETIDLKKAIENKFLQFEELIKGKELHVTLRLEEKSISINKDLIDILLNNLLSNSIRHNIDGGEITCSLSQSELVLANTGLETNLDPDKIFNRFQKGSNSKGSGLGLAVVKEICDTFHITIIYTYKDFHIITLYFPDSLQ